jgi:hypothetical protein
MSKGKDPVTGKRLTGRELIAQEIAGYRRDAKLDSWTSFVEALDVPSDIAPALMTGRRELMAAVQPRDLPAFQVEKLYTIIGVLLETSAALRQHTQRVAQLVDNLNDSFMGVTTSMRKIDDFANFRVSEEEDDDDVAA